MSNYKQTIYSFTISASGIIVGTVVGSLTYTTIKTITNTLCLFTSKGTFILSLVLGYSADYLFGSRIGYVSAETLNHCSDLFLIKPIDSISTKTATIASVLTGSLAGLTTSILIQSSCYAFQTIYSKTNDIYYSQHNPYNQTYYKNNHKIKTFEQEDYLLLEN